MNPLGIAFLRLADSSSQCLAFWHMDNGAEFQMALPRGPDVLPERFSDAIEFPFTFANIVCVGLLSEFPNTSFACDVDAAFAKLADIAQLEIEREYQASVGGQTGIDVLWLRPKGVPQLASE